MNSPLVRSKSEEEAERDHYAMKTIGEISQVGNTEKVPVGGVGVVVGLDGTGGESPMDDNRKALEDYLRKKGIKNIQELMTSSQSALVVVSGWINPGSRKGDHFDVEVKLPPRTKATSLRGGYLKECALYNFEHAHNLSPNYKGPRTWIPGHPIARGEGPVLAGFGDGKEGTNLKEGVIWSGGRYLSEAPLAFLLTPGNQYGSTSLQMERRINEVFHGATRESPINAVATAQRNLGVFLRVPAQYRLNMERFIRVGRLIPYNPSNGPDGDLPSYKRKLADDLVDPSRTVVAALRLEALGPSSIPTLKQGLESPDPLVRFCSAESLAYLGSPSSCDELARAMVDRPMLRAYALTALASLGESASRTRLQELLTSSTEDEVRYGAFSALRMLDEQDPTLQGELLADSFWLHQVAPKTTPLVHYTSNRRAEIVLFGPEPLLMPEFYFLAGDFVITAAPEDDKCTISRVNPHGAETTRRQCSLKLGTILRTLADLGAGYPEVVGILQQAQKDERLSCRICCDALPQGTSVFDLEEIGKSGKSLERLSLPPGRDTAVGPKTFDGTELPNGPALDPRLNPTLDRPRLDKQPTFTGAQAND
jgi:hypothetical protein